MRVRTFRFLVTTAIFLAAHGAMADDYSSQSALKNLAILCVETLRNAVRTVRGVNLVFPQQGLQPLAELYPMPKDPDSVRNFYQIKKAHIALLFDHFLRTGTTTQLMNHTESSTRPTRNDLDLWAKGAGGFAGDGGETLAYERLGLNDGMKALVRIDRENGAVTFSMAMPTPDLKPGQVDVESLDRVLWNPRHIGSKDAHLVSVDIARFAAGDHPSTMDDVIALLDRGDVVNETVKKIFFLGYVFETREQAKKFVEEMMAHFRIAPLDANSHRYLLTDGLISAAKNTYTPRYLSKADAAIKLGVNPQNLSLPDPSGVPIQTQWTTGNLNTELDREWILKTSAAGHKSAVRVLVDFNIEGKGRVKKEYYVFENEPQARRFISIVRRHFELKLRARFKQLLFEYGRDGESAANHEVDLINRDLKLTGN
jgi:hypothetical protein